MVFCAAAGCYRESRKSQDISFYRLPRDQTLRAKCLQKLKRDNLPSENKSDSVTFNLKMDVSNETWRYLIIYCEDF